MIYILGVEGIFSLQSFTGDKLFIIKLKIISFLLIFILRYLKRFKHHKKKERVNL